MRLLGYLVALLIALVGLTGVFAPDHLVALAQHLVTPAGICVAAGLRVGIGLVLAGVAPISRAPKTLRIFGVIAVLAGVASLFLEAERAEAILNWWTAQGPAFVRLGAGFAAVVGGAIAFAVTPRCAG